MSRCNIWQKLRWESEYNKVALYTEVREANVLDLQQLGQALGSPSNIVNQIAGELSQKGSEGVSMDQYKQTVVNVMKEQKPSEKNLTKDKKFATLDKRRYCWKASLC
jgi:hypothetical protein